MICEVVAPLNIMSCNEIMHFFEVETNFFTLLEQLNYLHWAASFSDDTCLNSVYVYVKISSWICINEADDANFPVGILTDIKCGIRL